MQNDRDFIEVHSLELVGYLMQPFARTHNNATINPTSQRRKESLSPNVRYLNSYSCQLRCREGRQSASKWANWCANTWHNYNIIQAHTRAVMANTDLQQHEICGIHISWSIYLTHLFTTTYHLSRLLSSDNYNNPWKQQGTGLWNTMLELGHIWQSHTSHWNPCQYTIQYIASYRIFSLLKERVKTFNSNMQFSWKSE